MNEIVEKYNFPTPRYTSYPPANRFRNVLSDDDTLRWIVDSNECNPKHISIYVHIPFCEKLCHYCGCHAMFTKDEQAKADYMQALKKELDMLVAKLDKTRKVAQIHYGGGTPNFVDISHLKEINLNLFNAFETVENPEISIECNPSLIDKQMVKDIVDAGFNRISLGIQDTDEAILTSVNRALPSMPIGDIVELFREAKNDMRINFDFIYGLPGQDVKHMEDNVELIKMAKPDRIATFSYAHVPWIKPNQKAIEKLGLPDDETKLSVFNFFSAAILDLGYESVGFDHFVLPGDALFHAKQSGELHRNFQGYCTKHTTGQVYGIGVSSISQLANVYIQNTKNTAEYIESINKDKFPVARVCYLTDDDKRVRSSIEDILCNYKTDISKYGGVMMIPHKTLFEELIEDGVVEYDGVTVKVRQLFPGAARVTASTLDPYFNRETTNQHSKSI
ncbi:MAG: oxygen-independent coproporphyrinogen III oxidase [Bacteroidales bacterium]